MSDTLIISDASPLIIAARANELILVHRVYESIIIPPAVYEEIVIQGRGKPGAVEIKKARNEWIQVEEVQDTREVSKIHERLGLGESEALVLAKELKGTLYADEAAVITEARRRKIPITSTIIMLLTAKEKGLIKNVQKKLDRFVEAGFWLDDNLYEFALKEAGEL